MVHSADCRVWSDGDAALGKVTGTFTSRFTDHEIVSHYAPLTDIEGNVRREVQAGKVRQGHLSSRS